MANDITSINSNRSQLSSNASNTVKIRDGAGSNGGSDNSAAGDRVTLTNTASRLQNLEQKLSGASPIDAERVAAVQKAISSGEYSVDADRVADKMLAFEENMIR